MANFKYFNQTKYDVGDWKKSKDDSFHPGFKSRSHISRNSSINGRQLSPHQLEEIFCETVGGVSWEEVTQNQKYMYQHDKILEWKDSAVEKAFWEAKNRFWAKVHGKPCDIKLPDPDIFIDNVDWNSTIDPELLSELENWESNSHDEIEKQDSGVIVGIPTAITQSDLTPDGWGDAEEVNPQEIWNRRDDVENGMKRVEMSFSNGWEDDHVYATLNQNKVCDQENKVNGPTWNGFRKQHDYGHPNLNNGYNRKNDHGGWGTSRYKISRYQHYDYSQPLDNYRGHKGRFSCECPLVTWKPVTRR